MNTLKKYYIIIPLVLLFVLLLAGLILGYCSSYIGYSGYKKNTYNRFSDNIEESKRRKVFIKELNFKVSSDTIEVYNVFIEKVYKWGDSDEETRILYSNDSLMVKVFHYQIVVSFPNNQFGENILVLPIIEQEDYKPVMPISNTYVEDTIYFKAFNSSFERKLNTKIKVWDTLD